MFGHGLVLSIGVQIHTVYHEGEVQNVKHNISLIETIIILILLKAEYFPQKLFLLFNVCKKYKYFSNNLKYFHQSLNIYLPSNILCTHNIIDSNLSSSNCLH